jgi:hypothetical protein
VPDTSVGCYGYAPSGGVSFLLSDFDSETDRLESRQFEETPAELLPAGGIVEAATDGTALPGAFADHDGGVYFHMLAASVTLE